MRRRAFVGALAGVGLAAIALALGRGPREEPRAPVAAVETPSAPALAEKPPAPVFSRNPFEYGSAPVRRAAPPEAPAAATRFELPAPPPAPVARVIGFVRRGGTDRAALMLRGEMVLLAVGEESAGFTLLAANPDAGVRVRTPEGAELALPVEP